MDRILIVDDDLENILLARAALERAGFEVEATTDPRQAAPMAEHGEFDAVVLDLVMPELSGFDVLSSLRANAKTRSLPILFLSSLAEVADRVRGVREGADDYLGKPFHPEELVLRLERLVAASSAQSDGLEGRLEDFPIADVIQTVLHGKKSGFLVVLGGQGTGRLLLHNGQVLSASYAKLIGKAALVAMLSLHTGRFRFTLHKTSDHTAFAAGAEPLNLQATLFEVAWIEDELGRRREHLPDLNAPLQANPLGEMTFLEGLPEPLVRTVHERVQTLPGITLNDLLNSQLAAPEQVRLATAWLVENAGLAHAPDPPLEDRP